MPLVLRSDSQYETSGQAWGRGRKQGCGQSSLDNSPAAVGSSVHSSSRAELCASRSQKEARVPEGDELRERAV